MNKLLFYSFMKFFLSGTQDYNGDEELQSEGFMRETKGLRMLRSYLWIPKMFG